jgi:cephalosporin hydroxylase
VNVAREAVDRGSIQHPDELAEMLTILAEHPPERAVEVGVCFGGTLWALAQVCRSLVGVDRDLSLLDQRNRTLPLTMLLEGDSADLRVVNEAVAWLRGKPDFIFIDAAHETEAVLADYAAWRPALAEGGVMGFHDINGRAADAWRELLARVASDPPQGVRQIVHAAKDPEDGRGIGLLRF